MRIPAADPEAAYGGPSPLPPLPPLVEETGGQLWNRNFRLFFVARTAAVFGDGMIPPSRSPP
ncbi:MFS transporter, partial [Streptomyces sp. SID7803]|nr:MFS transporter [Streptomyces sp. SID7803]